MDHAKKTMFKRSSCGIPWLAKGQNVASVERQFFPLITPSFLSIPRLNIL